MQKMTSKKTYKSAIKHSEHTVDISELRQKLTSFGWIQCDNPSCLKWRTVRTEVAQQVKEDTPWTCNMNEDQNYNRCSVPEEDISLYDKLAKRVKVDLVKSKLKPGSLVWAKVQGYCRWPALITADPLSGEYIEEDEIEAYQYHVEFLGDIRSHGWVKTNLIEVFGPGNVDLPTDDTLASSSNKIKKGKVKGRRRKASTSGIKNNDKGRKVKKAIQEAMQLLPLGLDERLKTCQFVTFADVNEVIVSDKSMRDEVIQVPQMNKLNKKRKQSTTQEPSYKIVLCNKHENTECAAGTNMCSRNKIKKQKVSLGLEMDNIPEDTTIDVKCLVPDGKNMKDKDNVVGKVSKNLHREVQMPELFAFPSLLFNTSKEERFITDVQMYGQKERAFEKEIAVFMLKCRLTLADAPTWQNIQVSKFCIFLAVLERDGFLKVSKKHQWPLVYNEVTHQHCTAGGGLVKTFYSRNLYPFELYISGHDYAMAVGELHRQAKKCPVRVAVNEHGDSGVDTDDLETSCDEDDDLDSPDIIQQLNELDQILKSLEQKPSIDNEEGCEIDTNVQVVPLQGFSVENSISDDSISNHSNDEHIFHEMKALQYDLDVLQDQIDFL